MHIMAGVAAGVLLGAIVGAVVFFWQVERADGRLAEF